VWLFTKELNKISNRALEFIEECELLVSPMVVLELEFLYEIGRLRYRHNEILASLSDSIDLKICTLSFATIAKEATNHSWTRDPFDRLIVANTICANSHLISKDRKILENFNSAIW
jgi:PIN domain nuclease of toxin-antitoxin system